MRRNRIRLNPQTIAELAQILARSYIATGGDSVDPRAEALFERIAERIRSLADPTRLAILHLLQKGEMRVTDILANIGGSQANISKHLGVLRQAGFVTCRRDGVNVYYSVADASVFEICRVMCDSIERAAEEERKAISEARATLREGS
ncbi:MAG: ArsR/SmtB family transcription factor [Thermoanaerobaculum sp.]